MTPQTLEIINGHLDQWREIDMPRLVGESHPDSKLVDLNFSDLNGKEFINLAGRIREQFEEEFSQFLALCYPVNFTGIHLSSPDSTQGYALQTVVLNFISQAKSSNFPQAAQYLKVLVNYQMQHGFWDRSQRKIHHPGSIGVKNLLEELQTAKVQLETSTENFRGKISNLKIELEGLETKTTGIAELYTTAQTKASEITELQSQVNEIVTEIQNSATTALTELVKIESNRTTFEEFTKKITEREKQLESQALLTEKHNAGLATIQDKDKKSKKSFCDYVDSQKGLIAGLIKEATLALELNTARGLSKEFQAKANNLRPTLGFDFARKLFPFVRSGNGAGWWLVGSSVFIVLAILMSIALIVGEVDLFGLKLEFQPGPWHQMIGRISIVGLLVTSAVFCAKQYTKARNLYEDYAYRQIITSSLPAFLKQLESYDDSETMGAKYLQKVLDEVKRHPTHQNEAKSKKSDIHLSKEHLDLLKRLITSFNGK